MAVSSLYRKQALVALFHIKFQSIPSLVLYTLTDNAQFYGLEVFLNNILMVVLFRSNNRMVIFPKTKKIISQQTCKGPYIYKVNIEVGWERGRGGGGGYLKICQVFADFFCF